MTRSNSPRVPPPSWRATPSRSERGGHTVADMTHHDRPHEHADTEGNDGSTEHPDTEVTAEDEQDTASGGPPERP